MEVSVVPKHRDLKLDNISKYRYRELYNWCLQYWDWQKPKTKELFVQYRKNCDLLELTLHQAIIEIYGDNTEIIYPIMLEAIINENVTYEYLSIKRNIPCGKYLYWKIRRRFYYLLDRKK